MGCRLTSHRQPRAQIHAQVLGFLPAFSSPNRRTTTLPGRAPLSCRLVMAEVGLLGARTGYGKGVHCVQVPTLFPHGSRLSPGSRRHSGSGERAVGITKDPKYTNWQRFRATEAPTGPLSGVPLVSPSFFACWVYFTHPSTAAFLRDCWLGGGYLPRHCYGIAPMGTAPHGSNTVAVPWQCRSNKAGGRR